ncbi:MAG: pectate lyase [Candidatus Symbiothrix sp.]|jgi:pectate lyase|nr:pectate lyase [Candidatus Symbiothrix sp.]
MKKLFILFVLVLPAMLHLEAQVALIESSGWLESAFVKWSPLADADGYNVYVKAADAQEADYQKLDGMLVRRYATYFRADALGLKAGNYQLKVVPVLDDQENTAQAAVSEILNVKAHTREGFAFSVHSPQKTASGAYNDDGTLRSGARILYLTAANAKTVQLGVVVDNKGKVETRTGIGDILQGREKGYDNAPLAIRMIGNITGSDMIDQINSLSLLDSKGKSATPMNTTIEGVGEDATANGWGIHIRECVNVEIRNIGFMNFPDDGVSLEEGNKNIWVHNNDFFYGKDGGGDKNKGDGALDSKTSGYSTFSFNHFWDSGKCNLLGNGTEPVEVLTYHHNWYDHSDSRHPRVRFHTVHVYNNYYDGNSKYGIGAAKGGPSIFAENNYFRHCKKPMLISLQGTDVWDAATSSNKSANGTFSSETGGIIKAYNNVIVNPGRFVPYGDTGYPNPTVDFDAVVVSSREEPVPSSIKTFSGNFTYNNFDTDPNVMYSYAVQTPEEAKATVMQYAGRVNGGDLKYSFPDTEDTNDAIISALSALVKTYKGTVLEIGGVDTGNADPGTNPGTDPGTDPGADPGSGACVKEYIQATSVNTDNAFTITGKGTTNGGTQSYKGVSLTTGLKMESSASIVFTTTTDGATLIVGVVANKASSSLKLNTVKTITGIGTTFEERSLQLGTAGTYTIEKGDNENYIYYVVVKETCAPTGLSPVGAEGAVVATKYYNLLGNQINQLQRHTIYIREDVYENGAVKRTKLIY